MNKEIQKNQRIQIKCPKCGKRGGVRGRKDAYADYKIFTDGEWEYDDIAVMDTVHAYECFECFAEVTTSELIECNPELKGYL